MIIKHSCGHEAEHDFKPDETDFIDLLKESKCRHCLAESPRDVMGILRQTCEKFGGQIIESNEQAHKQALRGSVAVDVMAAIIDQYPHNGTNDRLCVERAVRIADFLFQEINKTT